MKNIKLSIFTAFLSILFFCISSVNAAITNLDVTGNNFGNIEYSKVTTIEFENNSGSDVTLRDVEYSINGRYVITDELPFTIADGEKREMELEMGDNICAIGVVCNLELTFNKGESDEFVVNITSTVETKKVDEPTVSKTYTYNGEFQRVELSGFDDTFMTLTAPTGKDAGNQISNVSLKGSNYEWAPGSDGKIEWTIEKATMSLSEESYLETTGNKLSAIDLPKGWAWENEDIVIKSGLNTYKATYTPEDTANYNTVTGELVKVTGKNEYTITTTGPKGVTFNNVKNTVFEGDDLDILIIANQGHNLTSVKVNGKEVLTKEGLSTTIKLEDIKENTTVVVEEKLVVHMPKEGDKQNFILGSFKKLMFTFDLEFDNFYHEGIYLNDKLLSEEDYDLTEGSVVLTLSNKLLESLEPGNHIITAELEDGTVIETAFTVAEPPVNPDTSDNILSYVIIAGLTISAFVATLVINKKSKL